MTKETVTDIEIRISSLKGIPSATLSQLDELFEREFSKEPTVYSDADWFVMGFLKGLLVSQVGVLKRAITVENELVVVGGISGVVTRSEYRRRGYATCLMRSAQTFMREELPTDFGLLICNTRLESFYKNLGWKAVPGPTTYAQPGGSQTCKGLTMVLECGRAEWPGGSIDLCGYPW
jgi:aminoglycoside 2'-N-acetyltransferase I